MNFQDETGRQQFMPIPAIARRKRRKIGNDPPEPSKMHQNPPKSPIYLLYLLCVALRCLCCWQPRHAESAFSAPERIRASRLKRDPRKKRKRVGKIARLSRVRFFFDPIFQVWRGRIPEKTSQNGHFRPRCEGLWCRDRHPAEEKRSVP